MGYLFRVEKRAESRNGLLGYDWIEVLAIEPWALAFRTTDYGSWCDRKISNMYVCLTEHGLIRIGSEDFWVALEELSEYDERTDQSTDDRSVTITTGDGSVVQAGGMVFGSISTNAVGHLDATVIFEAPALNEIADELEIIRQALRHKSSDAGDDVVLGLLAQAEMDARSGDEQSMLQRLRQVGTRVLDIAQSVGASVAAAAIVKAIGG